MLMNGCHPSEPFASSVRGSRESRKTEEAAHNGVLIWSGTSRPGFVVDREAGWICKVPSGRVHHHTASHGTVMLAAPAARRAPYRLVWPNTAVRAGAASAGVHEGRVFAAVIASSTISRVTQYSCAPCSAPLRPRDGNRVVNRALQPFTTLGVGGRHIGRWPPPPPRFAVPLDRGFHSIAPELADCWHTRRRPGRLAAHLACRFGGGLGIAIVALLTASDRLSKVIDVSPTSATAGRAQKYRWANGSRRFVDGYISTVDRSAIGKGRVQVAG